MSMTNIQKSPGEVKELLAAVDIDVSAKMWPAPGFVIIDGDRYSPHSESGTLIINGEAAFSAAWR